ncbi:LPXTG cell wall anchor domain-containing protein, partial [Enterococcus faecalis]|uniref:LPXTG cell wall anchor domain-containing protein n=1 Tax=Enterococcus faecalis TaxID=1351 RepID=UPI003CC5D223
INDQKKENLSLEVSDKNILLNKLLPKTNEKQELKYIVLGLLFLSIVLVIFVRKNKKIYK